ncbi:type I methionyl aminopeptidase [Candidatus Peregrinibacteria bacterium]|jgi:methionyl aminopeptidase|nr:type I methionyl aminopeptidase [Candidatus Peregrinibacteria bacterium]
MQTRIKTAEEIEAMRKGGKVLAGALKALEAFVKPGITGKQIDEFTENYIKDHGMTPGFKGYRGFPGTVCLCINDVVVHGIPNSNQIIRDGDIVTIDCGVIYQGLYTDSAVTYIIGNALEETVKFVKKVQKALYEGIKQIKPGRRLGDIGHTIEKAVKKEGYHIVRELVGHGIGEHLHEDPHVPNFGKKNTGMALKPGMTFAIEPIVGLETGEIKTLKDGWTIVTPDRSLSCQWEHTVLITHNGYEILTLREGEKL